MKDKIYKIEFLDADNNEHFTKVKPFANKKEATLYAKLILANLCDNYVIKFKIYLQCKITWFKNSLNIKMAGGIFLVINCIAGLYLLKYKK